MGENITNRLPSLLLGLFLHVAEQRSKGRPARVASNTVPLTQGNKCVLKKSWAAYLVS